ncbi:right-handed parallel beta-helix repeat-containing protein [Myxococcus landrumensis]|uniref:right-handed parallel beta-helix repeat-containing protein n=1 Tax=Myxococcus landrumensis TaxID=2813577 RepID=UPI001F50EF1F|nr:right-handed parallel beta-helix repeat-containing protein [Myxococcus landrumus]
MVLISTLALACGPGSEEPRPTLSRSALESEALDEEAEPLGAKETFRSKCPTAANATGPTLHVANKGPRNPSEPLGSSSNPFPTIMDAVTAALPGTVIQVRAGTYSEQLTINALKARPGTATAPIVLRGEQPTRPRIVPSGTDVGSLLVLSQPYWIVESLDIDVQGRPSFGALFEGTTRCSQLSDSMLHGGRAGGGVVVSDANTVLIEGNEIHDFSRTGQDSHGVAVKGTSRQVYLVENTIHDASGDAVQCQPSDGRPTELFIEHNQMYDCGENGIDVKACDNLAITSNVLFRFPNLVRFPWQATTSAAEAILVHEDATNIEIAGNLIFMAGRGISVGGLAPVDNPVNVVIRGNMVMDIYNFANRGNGQGIRVAKARGVRVVGNHIERTADSGLRLAADEPLVVSDMSVFDNTLRDMTSFVKLGRATARPGLKMDRNRYEGITGKFSAFGLVSEGEFDVWRSKLQQHGLEQGSVRVLSGSGAPLPLPALLGK